MEGSDIVRKCRMKYQYFIPVWQWSWSLLKAVLKSREGRQILKKGLRVLEIRSGLGFQ